ncbi:MAG: type II methionyl aminopeptidase [Nitrososphaerota archaeon]|uniref:type II methionyl aminopeptidase n=1 Tax=Candidatus Bathycorpusculum sp. TaxID=2994959 RepID=UPI002828D24E|nr:type II methionyl aminopeptidase [Candidatus Termiticorpusculum sp.]MCL2257012.1 type II methionyl aminopeptidase [Candidatus Termiticorpusculum sp.]MCL2292863.1 type II methionyl aminopeptidase [Candidatus Termiticorpusculum sp.]MDR0460360.1 type II methionyl aminopeptidase [Nitrososphaerota archaeon]
MPYDLEELEKFRLSGRILREAREEMRSYIKENMSVLEVCERAETLIRAKGGFPAFPCNVSINEVTAHYTSPPNDTSVIPAGSTVKIDMGVQVDGYVTDTAFTVAFNPEGRNMTATAELALKTVIDNIHDDMSTGHIGGIIETVIRNHGFKPISNLTGHSVGRYLIHAGTSIPNVASLAANKVCVGDVFAVEPFVTHYDALARVDDSPQTTIFRMVRAKSVKTAYAKQMLKYIETSFRTLPFAERWLTNIVPKQHHAEAFKELLQSKIVTSYPVFIEASRRPVAQAEHTLLIKKDGCEVLT